MKRFVNDVGLRSSSPLESASWTLRFFLDDEEGDADLRSLEVVPLLPPDPVPDAGGLLVLVRGLSWAIGPRGLVRQNSTPTWSGKTQDRPQPSVLDRGFSRGVREVVLRRLPAGGHLSPRFQKVQDSRGRRYTRKLGSRGDDEARVVIDIVWKDLNVEFWLHRIGIFFFLFFFSTVGQHVRYSLKIGGGVRRAEAR